MKVTLAAALLLLVSLATAEPPRFRGRPFFARQEAAPPSNGGEAPYPPSGWKPDKPFYLPGEYGGPEGGEEDPNAPESTTPSSAEEPTTTEADRTVEEIDQQGEPSLNIPEDARNLIDANTPVYVFIPERNVQPAPAAAAYQFITPGPYAGTYFLQDVVLDPVTAQYYVYGNSQRLVQLLKKR